MLATELSLVNFVESTPDGVLVVDEGRLVYANAQISAMLGYSRDEFLSIDLRRDLLAELGPKQADLDRASAQEFTPAKAHDLAVVVGHGVALVVSQG